MSVTGQSSAANDQGRYDEVAQLEGKNGDELAQAVRNLDRKREVEVH